MISFGKFIKSTIIHPHKDENGNDITIYQPHTPSHPSTWTDPNSVATFTPGSKVPSYMKYSTLQYPKTLIHEPEFIHHDYLPPSAGMIVQEHDGRVWVNSATNAFGGSKFSFPKGKHEQSEPTLQHTAIKEVHEETGLVAKIHAHLGDYDRMDSKSRFYVGSRIGGSPAEMGWETQAMHLIPKHKLHEYVHTYTDHKIVDAFLKHSK